MCGLPTGQVAYKSKSASQLRRDQERAARYRASRAEDAAVTRSQTASRRAQDVPDIESARRDDEGHFGDTGHLLPTMSDLAALNPEAPPFSAQPDELIDTAVSPLSHELLPPAALTDVTVPKEDDVGFEDVPVPACVSPERVAADDMSCKHPKYRGFPSDSMRPDSDDDDFYIECCHSRCAYAGVRPEGPDPPVAMYRCTLCTDGRGVVLCGNCFQGGAHQGHSRWLILEDT